MLVVVKNRNLHLFLKFGLNLKAGRSTDVFKIYAAKCWFQCGCNFNQLRRIGASVWTQDFGQANRERVDVGKPFEQYGFSLHHRKTCFRTNISKTKNRGAVTDYGDVIAFVGIVPDLLWITLDFKAWLGNTRCVCHG